MMRKINQILEMVQGNRAGQISDGFSLLPPMPFGDTAALQKFDSDLKKDEEMRKQFVCMQIFRSYADIATVY